MICKILGLKFQKFAQENIISETGKASKNFFYLETQFFVTDETTEPRERSI